MTASDRARVGASPAHADGNAALKYGRAVWRPEMPGWVALLLSIPLGLCFTVLVFYPLVQLAVESVSQHGLAEYGAVLVDRIKLVALGTTLWVSLVVTIASTTIAFIVAWSLRTSRSRLMQSLLWFGLLIPMSMSIVVQNYVWIVILSRNGLLNALLRVFDLPPAALLYTPTAVIVGMVYTLLPFAVFPLLVTFRSIPDHVLDAAESLGGGWATRMRTVVLPLSLPGLFITFVLEFVLSLGFYVTPIILGGPRATFLAKMIQDDLLMRYDSAGAAATSILLMLVALILVTLAIRIVGRDRFERALG